MSLRTVLGDVNADLIDRILPHEHLLCDFSSVTADRNHIFNNPDFAIRELGYLNEDIAPAAGTQHALVEVTLRDLGRDPEAMRRIAQASGVHVVMGTGWYLEPYYPKRVYNDSAAVLAEEMIEEIQLGVLASDGSRIRAGVIGEIGTHGGTLSPAEERVLRAAARTSNATGAAVTTHAFLYPTGVDQLDILEEEGIDPNRVAIGHVDTFMDHAYLTSLLRRGVYLQFDTCGREHLFPDSLRVEMLARLIDEGWLERLLLSSDRCHMSDLKMRGGLGYSWAIAGFCDLLRAAGIDEAGIDMMTRENPLRLFSGIHDA
ncbi:hypothetical protein QBL02_02280 [Leucobacter sp. UT-8R-CII-1-4]|uniref:phosphotriesterase family protein n=1 Tax=Leucobacter sp. UT-8R-CII-1-4 TaxID=3040075 RepID=UPI0024A9C144|nr:hypothetical protein [Leucobacter sp. UT-8R-CII-1-4]MDI6022370.1 hypothetical protein [Leucobacter sp. UT-8R-CII-1-4]